VGVSLAHPHERFCVAHALLAADRPGHLVRLRRTFYFLGHSQNLRALGAQVRGPGLLLPLRGWAPRSGADLQPGQQD
jgi:hypothetical protein